jgi:hypothetical protein
MVSASDLTVMVVMVGGTDYWPKTRPFIEEYCQRHGYQFRVFTEDCLPAEAHPSWNKLAIASFAKTPHVVTWDADLVPLPQAGPIHVELDPDRLGMVKIPPSHGGYSKLRYRYGRRAAPHMQFNCGLISIPDAWKPFLRDLFFASDYGRSIFWEQGALNYAIYRQSIDVCELDSRWNYWVSGVLRRRHLVEANCLHFASRSWLRRRNVDLLYRLLRRPLPAA